ncbi:MAG: ABC transporter ATPase [Haliscomenobacteraceae bacterium CHB4]|nr:ABC transporter ATPase [Haliscomenobacteraceae bacterium CHB4]
MTVTAATATATFTPSLAQDQAFAPESRVWIYTCNRSLTDTEAEAAQQALDAFTRQWTAHNQALQAKAEVFQHQYVILLVDETQAGASGCSIDKSVHFLENLGEELGVDFFERMRFGWIEKDELHFADRATFAEHAGSGRISNETSVVNTLVQTKKDLGEKWLVPFGKSWHRRLV